MNSVILSPMRFKNFVWPHNPRVYSITFERKMAVHKIPFGRHRLQSLGQTRRVLKGQGEFAGREAYEEFKRLATVFYGAGPGLLIHPQWQIANAYFTALKLEQEPLPDYVRYSFEFQERFGGYTSQLTALEGGKEEKREALAARTCTVAGGDTLWGIAQRYGVALEDLLRANPNIKNPNLVRVGEQVTLP